jgi:hypothetical protein
MGSGISITEKQAIDIIKRELMRAFKETESNRCIVADDGILAYENFDDEAEYNEKMKLIDKLQHVKK